MKSMLSICFLAIVFSSYNPVTCEYKVAISTVSQWSSLANVALQKMVDANVLTMDVAKNLLTTFGMAGTGNFANLQGSVAYTQNSTITFGGTAVNSAAFMQNVLQLVGAGAMCTADRQSTFVQVLLKFALDSKAIDAKTVLALAASNNLNITVSVDTGTSTAQLCAQKRYEWQRLCTSQYNGVTDGYRCFFAGPALANWTDAWSTCRSLGGTMAQIQTLSEHRMITTGMPGFTHVWLALQRQDVTPFTCDAVANVTYWYENPFQFNSQLTMAKTWLRARHCESGLRANEKCMFLHGNTNYFYTTCSRVDAIKPLCQVNNPGEEFALVTDTCLGESPIEVTSGSGNTDCIAQCRDRRWCRSLNFVNGTTCQFFPWYLDAADPNKPKTMSFNGTCEYYTYVV